MRPDFLQQSIPRLPFPIRASPKCCQIRKFSSYVRNVWLSTPASIELNHLSSSTNGPLMQFIVARDTSSIWICCCQLPAAKSISIYLLSTLWQEKHTRLFCIYLKRDSSLPHKFPLSTYFAKLTIQIEFRHRNQTTGDYQNGQDLFEFQIEK